MTLFKRGNIVLADFPHTERRDSKQRPALVLSSDAYNRSGVDVVVAQITSNLGVKGRPGDWPIDNWRGAGLLKPSLVRARLTTLHSTLVRRVLGAMPASDMEQIDRRIKIALGLK